MSQPIGDQIKRWVLNNNRLKQLESDINDLKKQQHELTINISEFMKSNAKPNIPLDSSNQLVLVPEYNYTHLSYQFIEKALTATQGADSAKASIMAIKSQRERRADYKLKITKRT